MIVLHLKIIYILHIFAFGEVLTNRFCLLVTAFVIFVLFVPYSNSHLLHSIIAPFLPFEFKRNKKNAKYCNDPKFSDRQVCQTVLIRVFTVGYTTCIF